MKYLLMMNVPGKAPYQMSTWPRKDGIAYGDQVNRTTELARLLLARGHRIVVCTSDKPDMNPAKEL